MGYLLPTISRSSAFSLGQFRESAYDQDMFLVERFGTPLPDPLISLMSVEQTVGRAKGARKWEVVESYLVWNSPDITLADVLENARCRIHD